MLIEAGRIYLYPGVLVTPTSIPMFIRKLTNWRFIKKLAIKHFENEVLSNFLSVVFLNEMPFCLLYIREMEKYSLI